MIPHFMKKFGGILPLWTGLTVPKSIEKYDNQPAELKMKKVKELLSEKLLEIGAGKVKGTLFTKLLRELVLGHSNRFLLQIPRRGLNHGRVRKKDKDDSKVGKKIAKYVKDKVIRKQSLHKGKSSNDAETTLVATESWNKTGLRKKVNQTYFDRNTIIKSVEPPAVTKNQRKTSTNINPETSTTQHRFQNALFTNYLQANWSAVVSKRGNPLSPQPLGLLYLDDYKTLQKQPSLH